MYYFNFSRCWYFIIRLALVFFLLILGIPPASGQHTSYDNYTGNWTDPGTWENGSLPGTNNINSSTEVYGNITRDGNLVFGNGDLHVYDTLIIKGDLSHGNNSNLFLYENSVLIVYGNLQMGNKVDISSSGTLIVTGNLEKAGSSDQGSFTVGEQDPPQVYIGGTVSDNIADNDNFPAIDCSDDGSSTHNSSGCNYGDLNDVQDSDYGDIITENCGDSTPEITGISSNSPVDLGGTLELFGEASGAGTLSYSWVGPADFFSTSLNAGRLITSEEMSGYYVFRVVNSNGCAAKDSVSVSVVSCTPPSAEIVVDPDGSICETTAVQISISFTGSGTYSFSLIRTHEVEGEEVDTVLASEIEYEGNNYIFNFDSPEWIDSGVRPAEATQYSYSLRDFEDENCAGSFTGANLEVWKLPETGPQYHILNSFGTE